MHIRACRGWAFALLVSAVSILRVAALRGSFAHLAARSTTDLGIQHIKLFVIAPVLVNKTEFGFASRTAATEDKVLLLHVWLKRVTPPGKTGIPRTIQTCASPYPTFHTHLVHVLAHPTRPSFPSSLPFARLQASPALCCPAKHMLWMVLPGWRTSATSAPACMDACSAKSTPTSGSHDCGLAPPQGTQ